MLKIELLNNENESIYKLINDEFNKYAIKNNVVCN